MVRISNFENWLVDWRLSEQGPTLVGSCVRSLVARRPRAQTAGSGGRGVRVPARYTGRAMSFTIKNGLIVKSSYRRISPSMSFLQL